jgi:ABC-type glycerol-3-phosphate transport system substrate-binding protein
MVRSRMRSRSDSARAPKTWTRAVRLGWRCRCSQSPDDDGVAWPQLGVGHETDWTKLKTSAEGQDLPDVFWINATNYPLYASNDQLLSLKDFAKDAGLPEDKYSKPAVDIYKWKGEQFAFSKDFDTVGLWYNKALFDKAVVEYPTADWTWEDVQAAAKKLTGKGVYGIAAKLDPQAWYYNVVKQGGARSVARAPRRTLGAGCRSFPSGS